VLGKRPDQAEHDDLVRQPGAPVRPFRYAELHVEPDQVLLDRGLRHHEIARYLLRGSGRDERVIRKCRPTQRDQHVEFTAGQLRSGGAPHLGFGGQFFPRNTHDHATGRAEGQHVAIV